MAMSDEDLARMVMVADQALGTAQSALGVIADALRQRMTEAGVEDVDLTPPLTHDGMGDPTACPHTQQIKVMGDVTICDACGVNLKAGVPIGD